MTRRLNAPYFAKRYIGDSETKVLHDLDREKTECEIKGAKQVKLKNGRPAVSGTCSVCGTKMLKIGKLA